VEAKPIQAQAPGLVIDDPKEIMAGMDCELLNGPIDDLVDFFGLGSRVIVALHKLRVEKGLDLVGLNMNKVCLFAGDVTGRRISLLREWVQLKVEGLPVQPKMCRCPRTKN